MSALVKLDRRSIRTRAKLREALAQETLQHGIEGVTVSSLTERADINRRTFYSHFKDVPDLIDQCETEALQELVAMLDSVKDTSLDELFAALKRGEGYPGAETVFTFLQEHANFMQAMLGPKGDGNLCIRLKDIIWAHLKNRFLKGVDPRVLGPVFNYYVEYNISAVLGVIQRWLATGMQESPKEMGRIVTVIMFVRPGDLYGKPLEEQTFSLFSLLDNDFMEAFDE